MNKLYEEDLKILYIVSVIRITLTIIVLYFTNFSLYIKMIIIFLFDFIDCGIARFFKLYKTEYICNTINYQNKDKLSDTIYYILLFYFIYSNQILNKKQINIIFILLLYRLIGLLIFLYKKNRKVFFYFPNFFEYIIFFWVLLKNLNIKISQKNEIIIIILLSIVKIYHEYILHYKSKIMNDIYNKL